MSWSRLTPKESHHSSCFRPVHRSRFPNSFYAFDLLNRDGELLVNLPFSRRLELLESLLAAPEDPLRLSPLFHAHSEQVLEAVRKLGLEGVVRKGSS